MNCPSANKCGSCTLLGTDYSRQLEMKRDEVSRAFESAGVKIRVHEVEGMENPFHYRNKVIAYLSMKSGRLVCGMLSEKSHDVVHTPSCLLHDAALNTILSDTVSAVEALKIRIDGHGGVLRNIFLRRGCSTGQVMVVLVTSDIMFHGSRELVKRLVAAHPEIRTVVQNVNVRHTSVVLGDREKVLYGPGYILDDILGHRFKISPRSFYQVNPLQTEKLYAKAIGLAQLSGTQTLLDAYCGTGTIGICASAEAGQVIGVEINRDAVDDAISNARAGSIGNARFFCADVSEFMLGFDGDVDVLMLDPPRSGCEAGFLNAVMKLSPQRIVYISCDPHTQARDVSLLSRCYSCSDAFPFDMFPHTSHIENIVCLYRNGSGQ